MDILDLSVQFVPFVYNVCDINIKAKKSQNVDAIICSLLGRRAIRGGRYLDARHIRGVVGLAVETLVDQRLVWMVFLRKILSGFWIFLWNLAYETTTYFVCDVMCTILRHIKCLI